MWSTKKQRVYPVISSQLSSKTIIENMMYLLHPTRAGQGPRSMDSAPQILAEILQEHLIFCDVYTATTTVINKKILKLYNDFVSLVQTREERGNKKFSKKNKTTKAFNCEGETLFDIFCEDSAVRKKQINLEDTHERRHV